MRFVVFFLPLLLGAAELRFNRDVRPILSDRCYACHGPDAGNRKGKLRLDLEAESRRAIVPGKPDDSELVKRVASMHPVKRMPPAYLGHDALKAREIEVLRQWIAEGARYEPHWSFIPPKRAPGGSIDQFIRARLAGEGLQPAPETDRRTLIRRVTLDLTGLPPAPEEVEAFVRDGDYERVVDRLLASKRYAERMAIRWLEAARYADTNGYQTDGPRDMWRWRDWVIDAFHRDMPWDQFTVEQLAGDLLPAATMSQKLATAFHRNHRTTAEGGIVDEEFRVEYVADRTETTSTVWLGLTVGCARCHDHKFDPIPQKDYYSMYAFFNNVPEKGFVWNFGNEEPVMQAPLPEQATRLAELDAKIAAARAFVDRFDTAKDQRKWERKVSPDVEWTVTSGLKLSHPEAVEKDKTLAAEPKLNYRDPFTMAARVKPTSVSGRQAILSRGEDYWEGQQHGLYIIDGKVRVHVVFRWTDLGARIETEQSIEPGQWRDIAVSYDGSMKASGIRIFVDGKEWKTKILFDSLLWPIEHKEPWRVGAGGGVRFAGSISDVRVYDRALGSDEIAALTVRERAGMVARKPVKSDAETALLRLAFLEKFAPEKVRRARAALAIAAAEREKYSATIPTVMVMKERDERRDTFVLKRGAYDAPGEKVEPAVLSVLPPIDGPKNRLGLARWLVSKENPLTARATVNRLWAMLFGIGIVKTVEDLGSQGEWPVQQDLLDWLAVEFVESGWSVKHMLKTIVMSETYRQSSKVTPELLAKDPENRLLARGPRARLSAEMIRDQALAVSGLLVDKVGGPPVRPYQPEGLWQELHGGQGYKEDDGEGLWRRTLYSYWRRTVAPPSMVNFDSPTREVCVVRESRTNTPLQALNLMNDVAFVEASRKLAERMMIEGGIDRGFALVLGRSPSAVEKAAVEKALAKWTEFYRTRPNEAEAFVSQGKSARRPGLAATELAAWTGVASLLLNLDEAVTKE